MSFSFERAVTIDHTKCGSSNSSNFPFLFSTTHADFKTVGNGGHVQNANGYDIAFYSDSNLTTALSFELERYNASTGEVVAWVKIPTLSASTDTVIYIAYGDSGITTNQSSTSTWDSNYKAVYHLKDGTTLSLADSTSNAANLTNHSATAVAGNVDGGMHVTRASSQYAETSGNFTNATSTFTVEFWAKLDSLADYEGMFAQWDEGSTKREWAVVCFSSGSVYFYISTDGTGDTGVTLFSVNTGATHLATGTWAHVVARMNSADGSAGMEILINNVSRATGAGHTVYNGGTPLSVGRAIVFAGAAAYTDGALDEVRYSNSYRSTDWLTANYNSQNSPSTFYTLGSESATGTSVSVSGLSATADVGTTTEQISPTVSPSGLSATGALGTVTFIIGPQVAVSGLAATADIGAPSVTISSNVSVSGLSATGAVGAAVVQQDVTVSPSGLSATGAVGSVLVIDIAQVAHFAGSAGYKRAQCAALQTPAFWYGGKVRAYSLAAADAVYTLMAAAKTDMSMGTWLRTFWPLVRAYTADGTSSSFAVTQEAIVPSPYVDFVGASFVSSTSRAVSLNGSTDLGGTNATSRVLGDISAGETHFAEDSAGSNRLNGDLADWFAGTGTMTDANWDLLKAWRRGDTIPALGNGCVITNCWPFGGNGIDIVGGEHLTAVGTPTYSATYSAFASPTPVTSRSQLINAIYNASTLQSEAPAFAANSRSLFESDSGLNTSGWTNLADVEVGDVIANCNIGAFYFRCYLFRCTSKVTPSHLLVFNNGHDTVAGWSSYGGDVAVKGVVAGGYEVLACVMPDYDVHFNATNEITYPGGTAHDKYAAYQTANANPWQIFIAPEVCALNALASQYARRSYVGLSGGANTGAIFGAVDTRINHAILLFRGSIAARRRVDWSGGVDWEQKPAATLWDQNQYHRMCGTGNRRFYLVSHPGDNIIPSTDYISAANYDAKFLAPIRTANPRADVQFKISTGSATHALYQADVDDTIIPALAGALNPLGGSAVGIARRRRRL